MPAVHATKLVVGDQHFAAPTSDTKHRGTVVTVWVGAVDSCGKVPSLQAVCVARTYAMSRSWQPAVTSDQCFTRHAHNTQHKACTLRSCCAFRKPATVCRDFAV